MVCFELLHAWGPPKRRFYSSWNSLYFPEIFSQRKLRIHAIRRGDGKQLTAKVCSLHSSQLLSNTVLQVMNSPRQNTLTKYEQRLGMVFRVNKDHMIDRSIIIWLTGIHVRGKNTLQLCSLIYTACYSDLSSVFLPKLLGIISWIYKENVFWQTLLAKSGVFCHRRDNHRHIYKTIGVAKRLQ